MSPEEIAGIYHAGSAGKCGGPTGSTVAFANMSLDASFNFNSTGIHQGSVSGKATLGGGSDGIDLTKDVFRLLIGKKLTLIVTPQEFQANKKDYTYTGTTLDGTQWNLVVQLPKKGGSLSFEVGLKGNLAGEWPFDITLSVGNDWGLKSVTSLVTKF